MADLLTGRAYAEIPKLSSIRSDVSRPLATLVARALAVRLTRSWRRRAFGMAPFVLVALLLFGVTRSVRGAR